MEMDEGLGWKLEKEKLGQKDDNEDADKIEEMKNNLEEAEDLKKTKIEDLKNILEMLEKKVSAILKILNDENAPETDRMEKIVGIIKENEAFYDNVLSLVEQYIFFPTEASGLMTSNRSAWKLSKVIGNPIRCFYERHLPGKSPANLKRRPAKVFLFIQNNNRTKVRSCSEWSQNDMPSVVIIFRSLFTSPVTLRDLQIGREDKTQTENPYHLHSFPFLLFLFLHFFNRMLLRIASRSYSTSKAITGPSLIYKDRRALASPCEKNAARGEKVKFTKLQDAFTGIKSGDNIFVHGGAATPIPLLKGMTEYVLGNSLTNIKLHHMILEGENPYNSDDIKPSKKPPSGIAYPEQFSKHVPHTKEYPISRKGTFPMAEPYVAPTDTIYSYGQVGRRETQVQLEEKRWKTEAVHDRIRSNSFFTGINIRPAVEDGQADFNSAYTHEIPMMIRKGKIPVDVALIQVSPPDANGFCSLGTTVDVAKAAVSNAAHIVAIANKNMPRTFGDASIHTSHIDFLVEENDHPLPERNMEAISDQDNRIGDIIAKNLVENGATLMMGIGGISDACLYHLRHHKDLGIHTEMFSDNIKELIECNAITNKYKAICPGKTVATYVYGTRKLYDYIHDNPIVTLGDSEWVNDPAVIRQNPKVTAISTAMEIDLTGQVVADSLGMHFISGIGGQVDFIRGASIGHDGHGRPIVALRSSTVNGHSSIVPALQEGSGVVMTRADVHYVVTEHGIAEMWGKNMRQRAYELIKIADPRHQEKLEEAAYKRLNCMPSSF